MLGPLRPEAQNLAGGRNQHAVLQPEPHRNVYNIIQLICRFRYYEEDSKDFEFSSRRMEDHWGAGLSDTVRTLRHPEVLKRPISVDGVFTNGDRRMRG